MMDAMKRFFYRYGWDTRCRNLCPARMLRTRLARVSGDSPWPLLDVGCGQLGLSAFLRGFSIVGSDLQPSTEMLLRNISSRGRERPRETAVAGRAPGKPGGGRRCVGQRGRFRFVRSTATALPFRDRAFPAVSCIDVLEHLAPAQRTETITECLRVASRVVLFAFPDGARAKECDRRFQEACRARSRRVPAWIEEHSRYDYPVADLVAAQVRQAAAQLGRTTHLTESACEPLTISRLVRAAASRSTFLYALCNLWFGFLTPLLRASTRQAGYRAVLVAELSS